MASFMQDPCRYVPTEWTVWHGRLPPGSGCLISRQSVPTGEGRVADMALAWEVDSVRLDLILSSSVISLLYFHLSLLVHDTFSMEIGGGL